MTIEDRLAHLLKSDALAYEPDDGHPGISKRIGTRRRVRMARRAGAPLLAAAVTAGLAVVLISGPAAQPKRVQTLSTPTTSSTRTHPTSSTITASQPGPTPVGLNAVSYTAISAQEYWLLGKSPCTRSLCTAIFHTTDGGAHFESIPAPPAPVSMVGNNPPSNAVTTLRFADALNGYALAVSNTGPGNAPIWLTHDGGQHWNLASMDGSIEAFGVSVGRVYAVVGNCRLGKCTHVRLERNVAGTDTWASSPLSTVSTTTLAAISGYEKTIWVNAEDESGQGERLLRSDDGGITFSSTPSPCSTGLGAQIQAATARVLWAVCPTGTIATAFRSADGGAVFQALNTDLMSNSAQIAAADAETAVVATADLPTLRRTTNGGASFHPVFTAPGALGWLYIGFTTPTVGVAISINAISQTSFDNTAVWRTTDAGVTWQEVRAVA